MVTRKPLIRKIEYSHEFEINFHAKIEQGIIDFGPIVARTFVNLVRENIMMLSVFPKANPISRYHKSTRLKEYRNILINPYYIIYSVTNTTIRIIDIVHQSTNPIILSTFK